MSKTKAVKDFHLSIAAKIWTDVRVQAGSLEEALNKSNEIDLDKIIEAAHNGCIEYHFKVTGVNALEDWSK